MVTVTLEREDGNSVQYIGNSPAGSPYPTTFTPYSPRLFDNLVYNSTDQTWDETRFDTGTRFHYLAGTFASLAYYQTVLGSMVTMNYDAGGQLQNIQEPAGRLLTYLYTGDKVSAVQDWAQRTQQFLYDDNSNLIALIDQTGATTTYQYDSLLRLNQITDPNNFSTYYVLDDQNRVISRQVDTNPPGIYAYVGNNTVYTDPLGGVWTTTLDTNGNVTAAIDPLGATRSAVYNSQGLPVSIQNALAIPPTALVYDANGRQISRQDPTGAVWTHLFDPLYGNLLAEQSPLGYITTHTYFGTGETRLRLSTMTPMGEVTTFGYTSWGALQSVQSPLNNVRVDNWNSLGTIDTSVNALGFVRTHLYDQAGNRVVEIDEMGRAVTYTFDGLSRQTSSFNNVGAFYQTLYDGAGNVQVEIDSLGYRTTYSHNAFNEVVQEQDARGYFWTNFYDQKGRRTGRVDPLGNSVQIGYDPADRAIVHIDGMGRATTTIFDPARQPIATVAPSGAVTTAVYDGAGRRIARIAPTGLIDTSVYDAAGQLTQSIEPTGLIHTSIYDADGRHWAMEEPTGARSTTVFDAESRHIMEIDAVGRIATVFYSAIGQPLVTIDSGSRRHTTSYDASGATMLEQSPDGTSIQHFYDSAGRPYATLDHLNLRTTTMFDLASRVIGFHDEQSNFSQTMYDGVSQPLVNVDIFGNRTTATFDPARRRTAEQDYLSNYANFSYDASHALIQSVDTAGNPTNFHFDFAGRIHAVEDAMGYRSTRMFDLYSRISAHLDEANHATTLMYDPVGRWAATQDAMGSLFTTNFDPFNRVIGGTDPQGYQHTMVLDLLHRPIAHVDPMGQRTSVVYTNLSQIAVHTDQAGFSTTHVYDARANWLGSFDAMNQRLTVGYDAFSRPQMSQNPLGFTSTTQYDNFSRIQAQFDATGNAVTTFYDNFGRFQAQQDQEGNYTYSVYGQYGRYVATQDSQNNLNTTLYDTYGRTNGYQDPAGFQTLYTFDSLQRTQATINSLGEYTTLGYDARGDRHFVIDARNYRTTSVYDPLRRLSVQVDNAGYGNTNVYDSVSNLQATLDFEGNRTTLGYDGLRRQIVSVDSAGNASTTLYDPRGLVQATVDALGQRSTRIYDALGRTIGEINKRGFSTSHLYDAASRVIATVNARGYSTSYFYDALDRQIARQDADGNFVTTLYDSRSNPIVEIDELSYRTTNLFDSLNRQIGRQNAEGYFTTMVYDDRGLNIATIDALNRRTTTVFDALGRVQARIPADGSCWTQVYDAVGNKIADISPLGYITTQVFDSRNRLIARIDPLNRTHAMAYDDLNRMISSTDAKGQTTLYDFDSRGLEIGRQYADGTLVTRVYDVLQRLVLVQDATGSYTFAYDANSNLISQNAPSHPEGLPLTWLYDANDNRVQSQTPWGVFTQGYDARDLMVSLADPGSPENGVPGGFATWTYDARRQPIRQDSPNGASSTMVYDPVMRTLQIRHFTDAGDEIDHAYLSYDAAGRPLAKDTLDTHFDYGYDAVDRLVSEQAVGSATDYSVSFVYDANGRRIGAYNAGVLTPYVYDAADQLLSLASGSAPPPPPIEINCGGAAIAPFVADTDFSGGSTYGNTNTISLTGVTNPAPAAVYQSLRFGAFSYSIPGLTPGADYLVRLHFAEIFYTAPGYRVFDVAINGTTVLSYFDIIATCGSPNQALVEEFAAVADSGGHISITVTSHMDTPQINGIEVLRGATPTVPTNPAAQSADTQVSLSWNVVPGATSYKVYRSLTSGSGYSVVGTPATNSYLDTGLTDGTTYYYVISAVTIGGESARSTQVSATPSALNPIYQIHAGSGTIGAFNPDAFYTGGALYSVTTTVDTSGVVNAAPMAVYQTQRFGNFSYVMPSLTPGDTYLVRLHFAETFFTLPGQRLGNVAINGTTVLADFDIALAAGAVNKALVEEFAAVADGSGNITIAFTTVTNFPAINAVEILKSVPSVGTTRFLYDPNGSLLSATTPDGSVTTYLWDAANRLQSVAMPSGYMATQIYRWDDLRVNQVSSSGLETWTWDGQNVLAWSGPSEAASSLMVQGPNLVRAVGVDTDGSPLERQFHLDHQGSVQALTTSSQSIEADYETDAWGNEQTANTSTNRSVYLGGLGYWQEPSLGLNYVRARWMDPITGRWLSVDSVPTEPRYLYAGNSPTLRVDPSGRNFEDSHDTRPRSQRQTRPTAAPADQSIIDQFMKLVNVHLPELQHFLQDPETVGKELILHYNELVWHKVVEETADLAADLGINHIPDFVTRAVPGTFGLARSEWEAARTRFPSLTPFLEPYPVSSRAIHWQGGFVWGIVKGIAEMAPALHPITNLIHGFDNVKALWSLFQALRAKGLSKLISEAWKAARNRFFNYFEDAVHKSAFDQGKLAGILVANVVATILAVLSGIGLIKNLAALIEYLRVTGLGAEMLEALGTGGPKAVAELWKNRPTTIPMKPGKARVDLSGDLSGPNTVYPPTDGTAMAPRSQGFAPAAGNDVVGKAGEQIDAVTRRHLAGANQEALLSKSRARRNPGGMHGHAGDPNAWAKELQRLVNPGYNEAAQQGLWNCLRVAWEGDKAMAGDRFYPVDPNANMDLDRSVVEQYYRDKFSRWAFRDEDLASDHASKSFEEYFARRGEGARGLVHIETEDEGIHTNHVINVVVDNGKVVFLDIQKGVSYPHLKGYVIEDGKRIRYTMDWMPTN